MKTICIIGGSGFIGRHLAERLIKAGHRVTIPTRRRERCKQDLILLPNAQVVEMNVYDQAALTQLLRGHDAVINLVGILHGNAAQFRRAHVELTQTVIRACQQAGVRRMLHMSALKANPQGPSVYLQTKGEAENLVRQSGLDYTLFRPSVVFGAGDSFLNLFARLVQLPVMPLGRGDAKLQPVWVEDVVTAMEHSLGRDSTIGHSYNLVGPKVYTLRELVELVAELTGQRPLIIDLPVGLALLQATLLGLLPKPLMTPDNLRSLEIESTDPAGMATELDVQPSSLATIAPTYLAPSQWRAAYDRYRAHGNQPR
jgi:uncharacterized protein YbjT (DUF2867 family)